MSEKGIIEKIDDKIRQMGRGTFLYKDHPVKILDVEFLGDITRLETTRQIMERPHKEMLYILENEFTEAEYELPDEEAESNVPAKQIEDLVVMPNLKSLKVCESMGDALLRAMDEVEHNAGYKDQAQVMANLMGKGIDWAKMELDACRLTRDILRNR